MTERILHFNDNSKAIERGKPGYDRLYEVLPLIETLLSECRFLEQEENQCLDQAMIPTKVKTEIKQYLPNKPNK